MAYSRLAKDGFSKWLVYSRIVQTILAIIVVGLLANFIALWTASRLNFRYRTNAVTTYLPFSPFVGIALFAVSGLASSV
jgi:ABC-type maltose transport system permease subunit